MTILIMTMKETLKLFKKSNFFCNTCLCFMFYISHSKLLYNKIICHFQEQDKVNLKFSSQVFSETLLFSSLNNATLVYTML